MPFFLLFFSLWYFPKMSRRVILPVYFFLIRRHSMDVVAYLSFYSYIFILISKDGRSVSRAAYCLCNRILYMHVAYMYIECISVCTRNTPYHCIYRYYIYHYYYCYVLRATSRVFACTRKHRPYNRRLYYLIVYKRRGVSARF